MRASQDIQLAAISTATRIASFGQSISEAHGFGFGPGSVEDLSSAEFHEAAIEPVALSVSGEYLIALGDHYSEAADWMTRRGSADCSTEHWLAVVDFLRHASGAIHRKTRESHRPPSVSATPFLFGDRPPATMRFDLLGDIASRSAAEALTSAAVSVAATLSDLSDSGRSDLGLTETEIEIVRCVVGGMSVLDIGHKVGYSARSVHRKLNQIWKKVGAHSRSDGIVKLSQAGLL